MSIPTIKENNTSSSWFFVHLSSFLSYVKSAFVRQVWDKGIELLTWALLRATTTTELASGCVPKEFLRFIHTFSYRYLLCSLEFLYILSGWAAHISIRKWWRWPFLKWCFRKKNPIKIRVPATFLLCFRRNLDFLDSYCSHLYEWV